MRLLLSHSVYYKVEGVHVRFFRHTAWSEWSTLKSSSETKRKEESADFCRRKLSKNYLVIHRKNIQSIIYINTDEIPINELLCSNKMNLISRALSTLKC